MMYENEKRVADARAKVFKALGHPTRCFIVELLTKKTLSVSELTEAVNADVSTVSKHLSILKQAGVLTDNKQGSKVIYSLVCPCIMDFIYCIDDAIVKDAEKGISCILPGAKIERKTTGN